MGFLSLEDAKEKIEVWRGHYNEERPHSKSGVPDFSGVSGPDPGGQGTRSPVRPAPRRSWQVKKSKETKILTQNGPQKGGGSSTGTRFFHSIWCKEGDSYKAEPCCHLRLTKGSLLVEGTSRCQIEAFAYLLR